MTVYVVTDPDEVRDEFDSWGYETCTFRGPKRVIGCGNAGWFAGGACSGLGIDRIFRNGPATVVKWADGTKTVVKLKEGDTDDNYTAILNATVKKVVGKNFSSYMKNAIAKVEVQNVSQ